MKITGITLDQFLSNAKNAFSAANISDVKRDSVVKRFVNHLLYPEQNPGENEARLGELFSENAEESKPSTANVVMLECYEHGEHGGLELEHTRSFICITPEATDKKLRDLFRSQYPDHVDGAYLLDGHSMITDYIHVNTETEEEEALLTEEVSNMDCDEALDWLIGSFPINDLIDDSFFGDFLNQDLYKIRYEHSELYY